MTFECKNCPIEVQQEHCVSQGRFCFTPPSAERRERYPNITDKQMLEENLRERCIYEILAEEKDESDDHLFFNYLFNVHLGCLQMDRAITKKCAERRMENLKIDVERVNYCID